VQSRILHNCEFRESYHCLVITINEILVAMSLVGAHPCKSSNVYRNFFWGKKKTLWPESASKLYQPNDHHLLAKLVLTFSDRGCHVVSVTDPYGRILSFPWNMSTWGKTERVRHTLAQNCV
jgi:hypothetical protein